MRGGDNVVSCAFCVRLAAAQRMQRPANKKAKHKTKEKTPLWLNCSGSLSIIKCACVCI